MVKVFTVGHSTRLIEEFVDLLGGNGVKQLVDIRTIPRSRHNPQYEGPQLAESLKTSGISYYYLKELGGLRPKAEYSQNTGWRNQSFRNYADYMQTSEFTDGIDELVRLASLKPTAIMCAEAVPWRCHRSLVGDALLVRGIEVDDILSPTNTRPHALTSFAVVAGDTITYPSSEAS